jgi:hypothetical protein
MQVTPRQQAQQLRIVERHVHTVRHFSSTGSRAATVVLQNPRKDEDGNEMAIEISERAAKVGLSPTMHASPLT